MGKHHTEDYKLSAVKYALRTDNQVETCEVFDCKRSSLHMHSTQNGKRKTGRLADEPPNATKIVSPVFTKS